MHKMDFQLRTEKNPTGIKIIFELFYGPYLKPLTL